MPNATPEPQTILLIQHDAADAAAVRAALPASSAAPFEVEWARTCAEGLGRLGKTGPTGGRAIGLAAVLLDLDLPDSRGIETFDRVWQATPHIPIFVLSAANHEAVARLAVEHGAQDYLLKSRLDAYWLPKTLHSMIERAAIGAALVRERERPEVTPEPSGAAGMSAEMPGPSALPNRTILLDRLNQSMALTIRHLQKLAVLSLDLDHFKHLNDSLGCNLGDRLLQSVEKRLLGCVRSSDTVSRQGGDHFVILLAEIANPRDAAVSAERIRQSLALPHRIDDHDLHVTASIGIVIFPDDAIEAETLVQHAERAMHEAKDGGRNNFQFHEPDLNLEALQRRATERGLRQAIDRQELVLHYQPLMNLESGAVAGVEALVRWLHPSRGLLKPDQFMSVAEESGLIVPIGRWVMREGCRQARIWQDSGLPPMRVAINVSAVELRDKDFIDGVRTIFAETGLEAHNLELELTETFLMQDSSATARVLGALKSMGVQLAVDDFGTGYSSLSYMTRFPIDTLKIDQSFVHDLTTDAGGASIVSAVINLGHSLNMGVVAEGVETAEQARMLSAQHCPEAQGFFFSHPLPAEAVGPLVLSKVRAKAPDPLLTQPGT
jgi:diguanylate cyclase (GGDEF)-like protein